MKKSLYIIFGFFVIALTVSSCQKNLDDNSGVDYYIIKPELQIDTTYLSFSGEQNTQVLNIISNCPWTASTSANWVSLSQKNGSGNYRLSISVDANPSHQSKRTGTLEITNGFQSYHIELSQGPCTESISISDRSLSFGYVGNSKTVRVEANVSWTASSDQTWCKITTSQSECIVSVEDNNSYSARSATVTISGGSQSIPISVSQGAASEPIVETLSITDIAKTSATCTFSYSSADLYVTEQGVCYSSTVQDPTTNDSKLYTSESSKSGTFTKSFTGLAENTTYYARPYVTTSVGTTYGQTVSFTTEKSNKPGDDDVRPPGY